MNVGQLQEALKGVPEHFEVTIDMGFGYEWERMKRNWANGIAASKRSMVTRGLNPDLLDAVEGPYRTLNKAGNPSLILFQGVSDPDWESETVHLEL